VKRAQELPSLLERSAARVEGRPVQSNGLLDALRPGHPAVELLRTRGPCKVRILELGGGLRGQPRQEQRKQQ
jgi:hypothetical protein